MKLMIWREPKLNSHKKYENLWEISEDLYAILSYLKNTTGFDQESNLIEEALHSLNIKWDEKTKKDLKRIHAPFPVIDDEGWEIPEQ